MSNKTIDAEAFITYVQTVGRYARKTEAITAVKSVVFGLQKALFENDVVAVNHLGVFTKKQQEPKEVIDKYTLLKAIKPEALGISFLMNKEIEEVINMPKFPIRAYNSGPKRAPRTTKTVDPEQTELNLSANNPVASTAEPQEEAVKPKDWRQTIQEAQAIEKDQQQREKDQQQREKKQPQSESEKKEKKRKYQIAYLKKKKQAALASKDKKRRPSLRTAMLGIINDK